ncbi:hypothetical protein ACP4OV_003062 [Aristida adscensionis]
MIRKDQNTPVLHFPFSPSFIGSTSQSLPPLSPCHGLAFGPEALLHIVVAKAAQGAVPTVALVLGPLRHRVVAALGVIALVVGATACVLPEHRRRNDLPSSFFGTPGGDLLLNELQLQEQLALGGANGGPEHRRSSSVEETKEGDGRACRRGKRRGGRRIWPR